MRSYLAIPLAVLLGGPLFALPLTAQDDPAAKAIAEGIEAYRTPYYDQATDAFRQAIRLDPDSPVPHVWLGRIQMERQGGDMETALNEFDRALRKDPSDREAGYWKARTLQRLGGRRRLAEALELYEALFAEAALYRDVVSRILEVHVQRDTLQEYVSERESEALGTRGDPLSTFRYAEALRMIGELGRAEALLRGLRESSRDFAPGRVNYALALTMFSQRLWDDGSEYYLDAITFMEEPAVAQAMWEDAVLIADLVELQRFRQAETVEQYRELLRGFWKKRDPTKTTIENERIAVHYERLAVCWESYVQPSTRRLYNDPDEQGLLRLPPTYNVAAPFNDMGIIYLRHGEPDDRAYTQAETETDNMSWKYDAKGNRPQMIFHFEQDELGGSWRFVPFPQPGEQALARTSLDAVFGALVRGADPQITARMAEIGNQDLREGLTLDTHIPESEATPLDLFTDWASFKGPGGRTRLELYWGIPVTQLLSPLVLQEGSANITMSISIFTPDFSREIYRNSRMQRIPISADMPAGALAVDQETIALAPGDYAAAIRVEESVGNKLQIQEINNLRVRAFPSTELLISDVQIAMSIIEGEGQRFVKPGYTVIPLPTRIYQAGTDAHIYFGIYGLTLDEIGATSYRVSYQLQPASAERGTLADVRIGGLLGRRTAGAVEVTGDEESGIFRDVNKVLAIDVGESSFSTYRLRVIVEDLVAGTRAERVTFFHLDRGR